jgi:mannitol-1-phosphate 5-dehydrogenase
MRHTPHRAVMFGAGNVGRGFLGQLFSESGYEVVFVDVDQPLIAALNERRAYTIRLVDNEWAEEVVIAPVRAEDARNQEAVAEALAGASIAATAVGVRALPHIAPLVVEGIVRRYGASAMADPDQALALPLNIIVCENLKDAAATFRQMVADHLPEVERATLLRQVGFVDTVIARMVPPPTEEMRAADPSLIVVEPYKILPVDRTAFVGPIPQIVGLEAHGNFPAYTASKLYIHNCGHALLSYLGYQRGYEYGYQALEDKAIRPLLDQALAESRAGIVAAHGVEDAWVADLAADIVRRFGNRALGDTVFRLARDPLRKLAPGDRLVGAARLAEQAGIEPRAISWGIAAGYCFDHPDDPMALDLQERIVARGIGAALAAVSGILPGEPLAALVRERYENLRHCVWP